MIQVGDVVNAIAITFTAVLAIVSAVLAFRAREGMVAKDTISAQASWINTLEAQVAALEARMGKCEDARMGLAADLLRVTHENLNLRDQNIKLELALAKKGTE